jgi:hypothetical protein
MKRIISTLVLCAVCSISFAQLTYWKDTVVYSNFPKDGADHHSVDTVYNTTTSPITLDWSRSSSNLLTGWSGTSVCFLPNGQCYSWPLSANQHTEIIPAGGKVYFEVAVKALTTAQDGCSEVFITSNGKNLVFKYCAWPSSTNEYSNNNIVSIYPNPASSFINLKINDKNIASISVTNIIGKQFGTLKVDATKSDVLNIPVSSFANGMYLLTFNDANGKTLGVKRVMKN